MVKLWFSLEIAYLIDSSQILFIISSVKNFSNNEMGGSTVSSTRSGGVHLKPVGSEMSEWIHFFTCCELSFFRGFVFWTGAFVVGSLLFPIITFRLGHFISDTAKLRSWLPLRLLVSDAAVFSSPESTSLLVYWNWVEAEDKFSQNEGHPKIPLQNLNLLQDCLNN